MLSSVVKGFKVYYLILAIVLFLIFLLRFPSLFEPFWYGDEGIFAAVAKNLNIGGTLYQTAWDNKPPMIYLTYALIFKTLGVSMFWLRLMTIIVVLITATLIYEIAKEILSGKRALVATFIFGFLTSMRLIEGNLSLTEIFMILPITFAMFLAIYREFDLISLFFSGVLFAIASMYKQVGALEALALGIFLFLASKNFWEFVKKGVVLTVGFAIPFGLTVLYFAPKGLLSDYVFAAYTYYRIYLGESPRYALFINILKFLPIISAVCWGIYKRSLRSSPAMQDAGLKKIKGEITVFQLFLLWAAFSFLGSYFSGRTYGHYLVQATPAVSLLLASISLKPKFTRAQAIFAVFFFIPLVFLTKLLFTNFLSAGPINQVSYWQNFTEFLLGKKSLNAYNDYFDSNVNSIMALGDFLNANNVHGEYVYIWGDYPWLYAISDVKNPIRYVTSFHVFGVPNGREEVIAKLEENQPVYIIKPPNSIGYFAELERLIGERYTYLAQVENSQVFVKSK